MVEKAEFHPYVVTLSPDIRQQLAENRDVNRIDRFFYALTHDRPLNKGDLAYQDLLNSSEMAKAVNGYMEYSEKSGRTQRSINYLLTSDSDFDPQDLEELVYFSIWRSFLIYPWEEGYYEEKLRTYIYRSMQIFVSEIRKNQYDSYQLIEGAAAEMTSDAFVSSESPIPEKVVVRRLSTEELISTFVDKTTRNSDSELKRLKTQVLRMLSEGMEPRDAAELLHLRYDRIKKWIREFQELNLIDRSDRIDVNAGGSWSWSQHTAEVILNNPYALDLLTENEIKFLSLLGEGKTYLEIIAADSSLSGLDNGIKHKLSTHGEKDEASSETYRPRRRRLIVFLNTIDPIDEEEKNMIKAIRESEGNINQAAKILKMSRGKIVSYLKQVGYYSR